LNNLAQDIIDTGNIEYLKAADAWSWAFHNEVQLVGGPFSLAGHEYQIEVMQDDSRRQCAKKGTQMAFTESYVLRSLHNLIHKRYPQGILYLFPTKDDVTDFSTSRFKPLIRDNWQQIGSFIRDTDRANLKRIHNAFIFFRSGRLGQSIEGQQKTSSKLKSIPVDEVIFDEWDEMDPGAQEMAISRMGHSLFKNEIYLANPTIPDYGIDKLYQNSDQRVWMIPCDYCSEWTCLEQEFPACLKRQRDGSVIRACKKCGHEINPREGEWIPMKPDNKDMVGRWISHLNSVYVDPKELLNKWEDPDLDKQNFYNLDLGMAYIDAKDRLTKQDLYQCIGKDLMWSQHKGPCAMGIDVGKWLHVVIMDRPNETRSRVVYIGRFKEFNEIHDVAKNFNIGCCVIDKYPETRAARDFGESEPYVTYLCEYKEESRGFNQWDSMEKNVRTNRTEICDQTHNLVTTPGKLTLPRITSEVQEYVDEMVNTAKVKETDEKTGVTKYRYVKLGDEHYRHATNYAWLASTQVGISKEGTRDLDYGVRRKKRNWMLA
jgi:hypothetical protein